MCNASSDLATINDFAAHVDYIVQAVVVDHVSLATDGYLDGSWTGGNASGDGRLDAPLRWQHIAEELQRRGYTLLDLEKLLGGNLLRVYQAVFK